MMSYKHLAFSFLVMCFIFMQALFLPVTVKAQGINDFVIKSFNAEYELTKKDPQGSLEIVETIRLNFSGQNRGITRAVPATYKSNNLGIKINSIKRNGNTEPYTTHKQNENTVIRIGNPDVLITGEQTYEIAYRLDNVISFYDTYDELYWDVNGDQWLQPFNEVTATVRFDAMPSSINRPACFTGIYGSTDKNCVVEEGPVSTIYQTTSVLEPGETLTFVQAFEKGYFIPASWTERNWGLIVASPLFMMQLLIVVTAYSKWNKYGKEYKGRGAIAPYFERPKGLSVMQAGYVLDNKMSVKHVSASIIDLSIRNYIRIIESGDGKNIKHELELIRNHDDYLKSDEKILLEGLFVNKDVGGVVSLEKSGDKLYKTTQDIAKDIDKASVIHGYYEISPKSAYTKLLPQVIIASFLFIISMLFAEFTKGISVVFGATTLAIVVFLSVFMSKRSIKGNLIADHMNGLKLYLNKTEKERMKMQDAVAAPLARNAQQPIRDRDFFEKLLPFAVAMGVEKSWAKAFSDIYDQPPEWYQGNWSSFSTATLVNSVSATAFAASTSFSPPSSSGSSGSSSGGGFSGGGGGGGGGGGW
jgi:uncharacterized membrane protein YgcG